MLHDGRSGALNVHRYGKTAHSKPAADINRHMWASGMAVWIVTQALAQAATSSLADMTLFFPDARANGAPAIGSDGNTR